MHAWKLNPSFLERREADKEEKGRLFFSQGIRDQICQRLLAFVVLTQQMLKLACPSGRIII